MIFNRGKVAPVHEMKARADGGGRRGTAALIHNTVLAGGRWSAQRSGHIVLWL